MKQFRKKVSKCLKVCGYFYKKATDERRSYPIVIALCIIMTSLAPFINIIFPKFVIDELMGEQKLEKILLYVAVIVMGNFCVSVIIRILQEKRNKQEDWFGRIFDMMISKKAMNMRFENTEKDSSIEAEQKAETGMAWYSGGIKGLTDCVTGICASVITFLGVAYIIVNVSYWILLVSIIAVFISAFCTSKINRASQEVFEKTPAINKFYSYIYTKITYREYAKELRLYDGTDLVERKALENAKALNKMDNECAIKQFKWGAPSAIASALSYGFAYCFLGIMAIEGIISIAEFVMCITAIETFSNGCLLPIINNSQQLVMKCNFMSAFIDFMKLDDEMKIGSQGIERGDFDEIQFKNVAFKYPGAENYVLQDINLTIHKGERLSIVGLNGAGKSTLVKLICRLYQVTEGEILINGRNINEYSYEEYIKLLAVVFQDFKLFGYSLDENIRLGIENSDVEKVIENRDESDERNLVSIYDVSGITDWVNSLEKKGDTILSKDYDTQGVEPSGGQGQKVAIARALYHNAPIVILDEPTAALDPVAEFEIYNRFHQLVKDKTAIYISHRMSSCKFCDRIVVLGERTIQEIGSHNQLMERNGLYAQMFNTQAGWYVNKS
ncbi:MAG: ABC transporter ATP-binding protein [Lachnospiraceae bacterium]|nr:ABC transporter ATP-binding protein [Lachnospiraceae bacterium]